ncbi:hypothetical protein O0544_11735 [Edwardsiella anguillarum]|nr:hypothetical protein [Edwardsiella anguillarum]
MTTKHFPGGGARDRGTDPHYVYGQYSPTRPKTACTATICPALSPPSMPAPRRSCPTMRVPAMP